MTCSLTCHDLTAMTSQLPSSTDIVSLSALHLATTIGPDHWNRTRPQPISLSLHLHLVPSYLNRPGQSDNVTDSLHYGHLSKAIEQRVGAKGERNYASARALINDVTAAAFQFAADAVSKDGDGNGAGEVAHAVRVVLELPKQIPLAGGFEVELTTRMLDWRSRAPGAIVRVTDLILSVFIGVNPPERLSKQRVVTYLTFFEAECASTSKSVEVQEIDYPSIVKQIATASHILLLKFSIVHRTLYRTLKTRPISHSKNSYMKSSRPRSVSPTAAQTQTVLESMPSRFDVTNQVRSRLQTRPWSR